MMIERMRQRVAEHEEYLSEIKEEKNDIEKSENHCNWDLLDDKSDCSLSEDDSDSGSDSDSELEDGSDYETELEDESGSDSELEYGSDSESELEKKSPSLTPEKTMPERSVTRLSFVESASIERKFAETYNSIGDRNKNKGNPSILYDNIIASAKINFLTIFQSSSTHFSLDGDIEMSELYMHENNRGDIKFTMNEQVSFENDIEMVDLTDDYCAHYDITDEDLSTDILMEEV